MDLTFRELQKKLKDLKLGPVRGKGITHPVLLERYLSYLEEQGLESEPELEQRLVEESAQELESDYEDIIRKNNKAFYGLIQPHIEKGALPDLRPQETLKQMSDAERKQNVWRIVYEELSGLSNLEGEEEEGERELWTKLSNKEPIYEYIDEKREIVDRFINKYPLMFILLLRDSKEVVPLLSSTREGMLKLHPYLKEEMEKYVHKPLFMRNDFLIGRIDFFNFNVSGAPSLPLRSSLFAHAVLYRVPHYPWGITLTTAFDKAKTKKTIDARLSIIEYYREEMTISQLALVLLVLAEDTPEMEELLIHLLSSDFFVEVLSLPEAVSTTPENELSLPLIRDNYTYIHRESRINDYRKNLGSKVMKSFSIDAVDLFWPIAEAHNDFSFIAKFKYDLLNWVADRKLAKPVADLFFYMIYFLPHTEAIWNIIVRIVEGETYSNPKLFHLDLIENLLPLLEDKDVKTLAEADLLSKKKRQVEIKNMVIEEAERRNLRIARRNK